MSNFQQKLGVTTPIMLAPMAGASNADFVLSANRAGMLGSLGAGMMSPEEIDVAITSIKQGIVANRLPSCFNVNLMVLSREASDVYQAKTPDWLDDLYNKLGVVKELPQKPAQRFEEQFAILLKNPAPVASFTFGIISREQVKALHDAGSKVVGTANNVLEVQAWQEVGADAVVVQGCGAGGHQGGWIDHADNQKLDTRTLLRQAKEVASIPLISAGGVGTKSDVDELLAMGADMVAVGTLFLTTNQSVIHKIWQQRLLSAKADDTVLTRLFSGKLARGLKNNYISSHTAQEQNHQTDIPSYPTMNAMTKSLRAYGAKSQDANYLSMWAGCGVAHCRAESMEATLQRIWQK